MRCAGAHVLSARSFGGVESELDELCRPRGEASRWGGLRRRWARVSTDGCARVGDVARGVRRGDGGVYASVDRARDVWAARGRFVGE